MKILVTGGAGYIGGFMTVKLLEEGHSVVVFDNLERGSLDVISPRAKFIRGDLKDLGSLERLFYEENDFDAIMHFAGLISVEESEKNPEMYYQNNVVGSRNLFNAAINVGGVRKFIFSSSAAVYGNPEEIPIPEDHPKNPTSVYGKNKLAVEEILRNLRTENYDLSFAALRYFNAAGASLDGQLGERHNPETHIIPIAIRSALNNSEFTLYGNDYKTEDGTCVRDYIHVLDLVGAHVLALDKLVKDGGAYYFNVGTGKGYSNEQVVEAVKRVSSVDFKVNITGKRAGDADILVADPERINKDLGFSPRYSDLDTIIKTAWEFHSRVKAKNEK